MLDPRGGRAGRGPALGAFTTTPPRRGGRSGVLLALAALLGGCAFAPPQPWEKGVLARPEMAMDIDALEGRYNEHIYASKESASGGGAVGGAGCGCN